MALTKGSKNIELQISERMYKLMLVAFSWVVIAATVESLISWLPIPYTNLFIGLIFFFCGILYFSQEQDINEIVFGLLIFLSGFDLIYSSLEGSALVTGIYGTIVVLMSIINSYLQGVLHTEDIN